MSNDSHSDSNGSQKSLFGRMRHQKKSGTDTTEALKKGLSQLTDSVKNLGSSIQSSLSNNRKDSNVFSKGTRELDEFGYEKYNISEEAEIFISKVPDSALFNDGDPIMVRATGGNVVTNPAPAHTATVVPEQPREPVRDVQELFSNVKFGDKQESVVRGVTGTVHEGKVEVSNDFLSKIAGGNVSRRPQVAVEEEPAEIHAEVPVEVPVAEPEQSDLSDTIEVPEVEPDLPEDAPEEPEVFIRQIGDDSDVMIIDLPEDIVEDGPAEVTGLREESEKTVVEEIAVEEAEDSLIDDEDLGDCEASEDSEEEDSWIPDITAVDEEAEAYLALHSEEIQMQVESLAEAESADEAVIEALEAEPAADVVEESVVEAEEEMPEVVEETVEEEPVVEAPAEEPIVATPAIPKAEIPEGLYAEGDRESADIATASSETAAIRDGQAEVTSAGTVEAKPVAPVGVMDDGAGLLPPLQDPVRRRPSGVRFRFHNGVLQSVNTEKESEEGLRGPFDLTVGQTVSKVSAKAADHPVVAGNIVYEVMRLSVPELVADSALCFGPLWEDYELDDEVDALCFEHWVEVADEASVMELFMPELCESFDPPSVSYAFPDENLEAMCFRPSPEAEYYSAMEEAVAVSVLEAIAV